MPNAELVIDRELKEDFLGRPVAGIADEIEFRYQAGYDYIWISVGMIDPAGTVNKELVERGRSAEDRHFAGKDEPVWAEEHGGLIGGEEDLNSFPWPDPDRLDYSPFREAETALKPGMKVIAVLGKIFTAAWDLLGFERFCELVYEQPSFIERLLERIGAIQVEVFQRLARMEVVGPFWMPDDIAFHSGPLLSPQWLAERIFPYYRKMAGICRELVKDRIERLGREGAYCVGSSNSIPNYVPLECYCALLEPSAEFGRL